MKRLLKIFLSLLIVVSGLLYQNATVDAETTITDVAITYDTSKVTVSTKLTGQQVCNLLQSSLNSDSGPSTHLDTSTTYTYLAKKDEGGYVGLQSSDEKLNMTDEYYFVFNVEEDEGYVFGDDLPYCTINGVEADMVAWRSHSPTGDLNVYKKVTVNNDDWVFSVNITVNNAKVARGSCYGFVADVDGTSSSVEKVNWSIDGNSSSNTYIDNYGILYVDSEESSSYITVKATSDFDSRAYDTALVTVVNEEPYIDSVTISPKTKTLRKGESFRFEVEVTGTDYHDVKWYLTGSSDPATRVNDGYVYISSAETASTLILTAVSVRNPEIDDTATITVISSEVITNVAITYTESDDLRLTTYKTGYDISYALQSALSSSSGPSTHLDTNLNYTHLAKRVDDTFTAVTSTDEYLNETDEYWFVINVEENGGYVFGDDLPYCTINGVEADMVAWRSHSPTGDLNVYKRVYLEGQTDHKITFDANGGSGTMPLKYVRDGADYTIPECTFTAPSLDKVFSHWTVSGRSGKFYPGNIISNVTTDLTLTAQWEQRTLMAYIDSEGFLSWESLEGADYYSYAINNSWLGSISDSNEKRIDLYGQCQSLGLSSGTYKVELVAVKETGGGEDVIVSAVWTGYYTYNKPSASQITIEFISNGEVVARRIGNKDDKVMYIISDDPVNPVGEEGYVFSWWHLDSGCTEYFEDRYMTMQELKDENGGRLYARWAKGITEISVINVEVLGVGQTAQEWMDANADHVAYVYGYKYDTKEVEGIYVKSGNDMIEYTGEFAVGNAYYLKINLRFVKYENYRFAYDSFTDEFLVEDFYLNYQKVKPVIIDATSLYCEFYLPMYCPQVIVDPTTVLPLGSVHYLSFTTKPIDAVYDHVVYYSNNTDVVKVDNYGKLIPVSVGTAHVEVHLLDAYNNFLGSNRTYVIVTSDEVSYRLAGKDRFDTAFKAANEYRDIKEIEVLDAVVLAYGWNFPDALTGSYLAAKKNAPILLIDKASAASVADYIKKHLKRNGTIYVLGGTGVIPDAWLEDLPVEPKRLAGGDRFQTNLAILNEAGVSGEDILICDGWSFADSLPAGATGKPILLVGKTLTSEQKTFLAAHTDSDVYVIGGMSAVTAGLESEVAAITTVVARVSGKDRYGTSVEIAKKFFNHPDKAVLAYAWNFPDGLSAGPLAYVLNAPVLLVDKNNYGLANRYCVDNGITSGYIMGGSSLVTDNAVMTIFNLPYLDRIVVR